MIGQRKGWGGAGPEGGDGHPARAPAPGPPTASRAPSPPWWPAAPAAPPACAAAPARPFPSSISFLFISSSVRDKNRRGIGKSQLKWTASKMETPGSPRRRPSAPAPCATAGDGTAARHSVRPIESPWLGRARRAAPWQLHAQHGDSMAGRQGSPAGTPSRTAAPRGSGCGACPAVSILSTS
eukprot:SAG25_NODE_1243_length_3513_cov_82.771822_2_plen_182_part_00